MQDKNLGFTLIEILTVLLIISLIALLAYPNYISYIYKSNRLDAINSLFHYQALWQKCLLNLPDSSQCLQETGLASGQTQESLSNHYQISAHTRESVVYFNANSMLAQINDQDCAEFLLDSQGGMRAYDIQGQETTVKCW